MLTKGKDVFIMGEHWFDSPKIFEFSDQLYVAADEWLKQLHSPENPTRKIANLEHGLEELWREI